MSELPVWATQINSDYIQERVRRYNEAPSDDLLYQMGSCINTLTSDDERLLRKREYCLAPEQRYRILNQLLCNGFEIECDLALLIFGRQQLEHWLERSQQAYPDFEFYLCFEYQHRSKTGWDSGINYAMFWMPKVGAPFVGTDNDFPWTSYWDSGEVFWSKFPGGFTNEFDFTLDCYPDQTTFTDPDWVYDEDDYQVKPSDREANLMSVAQVLEHFTVPV